MNVNDFKRINVLRIIGECKTGGTETIALNYYKRIDHKKIGMDFLFYGESLPRFQNELEKNGDRVINVSDYTDYPIKAIKEIKNAVHDGKYDIVHAQLNALNAMPLLGAFLGGAKIRIAANHSTSNLRYETKKSIIKYILKPTSTMFATNLAACSRFAAIWCYGKKNVKKGKVKIIRNAIDLSKYSFSEEKRNYIRKKMRWENKFIIGHAGRFTEQKNHDFLIDIFYKIQQTNNDAILVLCGEGHLQDKIREKVSNLGISDKVEFLNIRFDVNELMQGMDLIVFPSLYEGFGNVLVEAQAVGLHCLASDVIPHEVKLTNYVKFLSLKDSPDIWANEVLKYANGYERKDTHPVLIKNGYEINSAARDLEEYYLKLVVEKKDEL